MNISNSFYIQKLFNLDGEDFNNLYTLYERAIHKIAIYTSKFKYEGAFIAKNESPYKLFRNGFFKLKDCKENTSEYIASLTFKGTFVSCFIYYSIKDKDKFLL